MDNQDLSEKSRVISNVQRLYFLQRKKENCHLNLLHLLDIFTFYRNGMLF